MIEGSILRASLKEDAIRIGVRGAVRRVDAALDGWKQK